MTNDSKKERSISSLLTIAIFFCCIFQAGLLTLFLLLGGLLRDTKSQAYSSLHEKMCTRLNYVENQMEYHWKNNAEIMNSRLSNELTSLLQKSDGTLSPEDAQNYLNGLVPTLITSMRTAEVNGAFVILKKEEAHAGYNTVYLHDEAPNINTNSDKDIVLLVGPDSVSQVNYLEKDSLWQYKLFLSEDNRDFFDYPVQSAHLSGKTEVSGYWSFPFRILKNGDPMITYTLPLMDKTGNVWGISGIAVSVPYFTDLLPDTEIDARDSLGYSIAYKDENGDICPAIIGSVRQEQFITAFQPVKLSLLDDSNSIYTLDNSKDGPKVMASVKKIQLYPSESPYHDREWYIMGLVKENNLLSLYRKIQMILIYSFVISLFVAAINGFVLSNYFTRPIRRLARQIRDSDLAKHQGFQKSPYREINDMTAAIQHAGQVYLESTSRFLHIINSINLPLGIFFYSHDGERGYVSDYLMHLLFPLATDGYPQKDIIKRFPAILDDIMSHPVEGEADVYRVETPAKYYVLVKCFKNEQDILGIIEDVTASIQEKEKIRMERDFDFLTSLYSRFYFEKTVKGLILKNDLRTAALIMVDVDNFKLINDTHGHICGDFYLKVLADYLRHIFSENCITGRRSGDEFLVFMYGQDSRDRVLDRIREFYAYLKCNPFTFPDGSSGIISISSGAAFYTGQSDSYDSLSEQADKALYEAKRGKKGVFIVADG